MHLWRKMKRVWVNVSTKLKPHKTTGGGRKLGEGGSGLLKLQDEVKMCGYEDVQVMWNLLNTSQIKQMGAAAVAAAAFHQSSKCSSKRRPSWMGFFWHHNRRDSFSFRWFKSS